MEQLQAELVARYQAIAQENREVVLAGGHPDLHVDDDWQNQRVGLTLVVPLPVHWTRNLGFAMAKLKEFEPEQYYYPAKDLHLTVIDLVAGKVNQQLTDFPLAKIKATLAKSLTQAKAFDWELRGLVATDGAVIACGYYSPELMALRKQVRETFKAAGTPVSEHRPAFTAHVTVARYRKLLSDPGAFLGMVDNLRNIGFGATKVQTVNLVWHDWYNHHQEVLATYHLQ